MHARCHTPTKPTPRKETCQPRRAKPPTSPRKLEQDLKEDDGPSLDEVREVCESLQKDLEILQRGVGNALDGGRRTMIWHVREGEDGLGRWFRSERGQGRVRKERETNSYYSDEDA